MLKTTLPTDNSVLPTENSLLPPENWVASKGPFSSCGRLHQLLSAPPKKSIQYGEGSKFPPQLIVGFASLKILTPPHIETETFDTDSNQIIRALAACQAGLFQHPWLDDTYITKEDLLGKLKISPSAGK